MTLVGRIRDWGRTRLPLSTPDIAEIRVREALDEFGATHLSNQVDIPLVTMPGLAPRVPLLSPAGVSPNLSHVEQPDTHAPFDITVALPTTRAYDEDYRLSFPEILSVLEPIWPPRRAGKAYGGAQGADGEAGQATLPKLNPPPTEEEQQICIHGLRRYSCELCRQARLGRLSTRSSMKPRTLDVFDLLLPYLQPPLEPLLRQPLFFPANRRPYPYQIYGIKFLAERTSALLGDEMGLGKTIQAIVALQLLFRRGEIHRVLVLCPLSLRDVGARTRQVGSRVIRSSC